MDFPSNIEKYGFNPLPAIYAKHMEIVRRSNEKWMFYLNALSIQLIANRGGAQILGAYQRGCEPFLALTLPQLACDLSLVAAKAWVGAEEGGVSSASIRATSCT